MKKREGDRRNPWSRRLGQRRQNNVEVDEERRSGKDRRADDRRGTGVDRDARGKESN